MPRYKILQDSFIDNFFVKAGSEIETDATPGDHWEGLDKKGKDEVDIARAVVAEHVEKAQANDRAAETLTAVLGRVGIAAQ